MMRLDIQAETLLSIQEEKRDHYLRGQALTLANRGNKLSAPARILNASGAALILAGRSLQHLAGHSRPVEQERKLLREVG